MVMKVKFSYKKENKQNPYIGLVNFQHFNNDTLYSDIVVKPENNYTETERVECFPIPLGVEQNGASEGYYPKCSVAYFRVLWKEFEPNENEYNYAFIYDILDKVSKNNQTLMFRLMPHSTRVTDDVPKWLKSKIDCPARPQGKRVKDSPSDPKFLEYFARAIKAFAKEFDTHPALSFMDISYAGAWGEGCSSNLFTEEQNKKFVDVYKNSFKKTRLISQVAESNLTKYLNESVDVGVRADCIGHPELTFEMVPSQFSRTGEFWQKAHVSFESYWWLGEWQRKGWDIDKILKTMLFYHVSTFNAKSLPIPWAWKDKIDRFIDKMGYHFVINEVEFNDNATNGESFNIKLGIENVGVAPIYYNIPLNIKLKGEKEITIKTEVDITKWLPGTISEDISVKIPNDLKGKYQVQVGIEGEGQSVAFATDASIDGDYYVLGELEIK